MRTEYRSGRSFSVKEVTMSLVRPILTPFIGLALLSACSDAHITDVGGELVPPAMTSVPVPEIHGVWEWTRVEHLTMPTWVAQFVAGIMPEGPITQARCESSGTVDLTQNGSTFSGTASLETISCETKGGTQFQPPGPLPQPIDVVDGHISGNAIRFSFIHPTVAPCPMTAVIAAVDGSMATALSGGGRCFVPGHPQSESPIELPPPPGGTSKTLSWEAVRR
jgi:hypothetical protein